MSRRTWLARLVAIFDRREAGLAVVLVATLLAASFLNPDFRTSRNIADLLAACAPCLIIACGVALVVIAGEIDISVGSQYGLYAVVMGLLASPTHAGLPVWLVAVLVLAAGLLVGLLNGLLVAVAGVPSIIVTLGMLSILRGLSEVLLGGEWITDMPQALRILGTARPLGLTWSAWTAAGALALGLWVSLRTPLGLRLFAIGSNAGAARLAGVDVRGTKIAAFALAGLASAASALVSVPQLSVVESGLGVGLELTVITAVVVGGVSIRGGLGTLGGVALAALLLGIVRTVLVFLKLGPAAAYWERAIQGGFILGAVVLDHVARRREPEIGGAGGHERAVAGRLPHWALLLIVTAALLIGAGIVSPDFVEVRNQVSLLPQCAELALLAVPMTLILLSGGIDLSIGASMALSAVCVGLAHEAGAPVGAAACLGVAVGGACGLANGVCIAVGRIHPLIVTLATLSLYRGLAEGISGGRPISGFPRTLTALGSGQWLGLPVTLVPVVLAMALAAVALWRGVAGRNIRAIGFNETACRFSGVGVDRLKGWLYTLSGAAAGLAAVMFIARRNTAKADAGMGIELDVITAVVLGGTSVAGGRGSIAGTLLGVLLLHELRQFIAWRWYSDELVLPVVGVVLIASVLTGRLLGDRSAEHA